MARRFALCLAVSGLVGASLAATPASAGLFDFLFGGGGDNKPHYAPPPSAAPPPPMTPRQQAPVVPSLPSQRAYCVRTCDGYYFAVGFVRNRAQQGDDDQMCAASCGNREMRLYTAPIQREGRDNSLAIDRAVDGTGELYTALPNANAFRTTENAACTCQATANGLPQIPISVDPTLRNGDVVVTAEGLKVYRGSGALPHGDQDFVGVADAKSLPDAVRQQMLSLQNHIAQ